MNRVEFMGQLERLLYNLPDEERQDALAYYNDYFDEAGNEHEPEVLRELGSPGRVAAMIRAGYQNGSEASQSGEYTETGYREAQFDEHAQPPVRYGASSESDGSQRTSASDFVDAAAQKVKSWKQEQDKRRAAGQGNYQPPVKQRRGVGGWVLIIILLVFIGVPVVSTVLGGTLGVAGGIIGGVFGIAGSGIAMIVKGSFNIIRGAFMILSSPGTGLVAIGIGCISLALGVMLIILIVWLAFKVLPSLIRAVVNLISRITHHGDYSQANANNQHNSQSNDNNQYSNEQTFHQSSEQTFHQSGEQESQQNSQQDRQQNDTQNPNNGEGGAQV